MLTVRKNLPLRLWQLGLFLIVAAIITFTLTSILGFFAVAFLSPPIILVIFFLGIFCSATALLSKSNKTDWGRLTYASISWMAAFASLLILGIAVAIFSVIPFVMPIAIGMILFGVVGFYISASPLFSTGTNNLKIIIFLLIGVFILAASAVGLFLAAAPIVMVFTTVMLAIGFRFFLLPIVSSLKRIPLGRNNIILIEKLNELKISIVSERKNSLLMKTEGNVPPILNVSRIGTINFLEELLKGIDTSKLLSIDLSKEESMSPYHSSAVLFCSYDKIRMKKTSLDLINELTIFRRFKKGGGNMNNYFKQNPRSKHYDESKELLFLFHKLRSVTSNMDSGISYDDKVGDTCVAHSKELKSDSSDVLQTELSIMNPHTTTSVGNINTSDPENTDDNIGLP